MKRGARQSSIYLIIAGMLCTSFLFLQQTHCFNSNQLVEIRGQFCAAEQANPPFSTSLDHADIAIFSKNSIHQNTVLFFFVFSLISLLLFTDPDTKNFAKRMSVQLIRHGPYQRKFLPYLAATHGL